MNLTGRKEGAAECCVAWTLIARSLAMCGLLLLVAGCERPAPPPSSAATTGQSSESGAPPVTAGRSPAEWTANEVLQRLLNTYRSAKSYEDQGVVRLTFRQAGQLMSQEWPVAVAFERPSKLSLVAYQATVKCDGKELKARIDDADSNNVDSQVVVRPAPKDLKLADLASDALLYDILSSRLRRQPIQLELLLESSGLVSAFASDLACQRLEDGAHEGRACFRVEVPSPGGPFVFWVDQANFLLRRLDYPAAALVPDLANDSSVSGVQLIADLRGAKIGDPVAAERFVLHVPTAAKRMKAFVIPPRLLPSTLFGKQLADFHFTRADGGQVHAADLAGKVAVLVWYHDHPACQATLQQVAIAHQRLRDEQEAVFYAVATDRTTTSTQALTQRLVDWGAELPLVRDVEAFGDKVFKIAVQPTIVIFDKQSRVQIFQSGGNPELANQVVEIVERLKRGEDLAAELVARHDRERQEYEKLVSRGGPEPGELIELPEAVIRRRSDPKHLKLRPLWTCTDIKAPGNIVLVESAGRAADEPRIIVFEGWRGVAEVDARGQVVTRHAFELPEQAAVTFARTAVDSSGRRVFAASAPLSPQILVFDERWKLLSAFPPSDQAPLQVVDLGFADVGEADGIPEIVAANVGEIGLVAVALTGEVRWRNRVFPNAVSVAVTPPSDVGSWAILTTGESGSVLRVNRFGRDEPPVRVGNWPIMRLFAGRFQNPWRAALLGLSQNAKGDPFAVGLSADLKECWNYPLPAGVHQKPIEPVTSSQILPGRHGEWWLAGPDGSIHLITEDGELFDSFYYGEVLTALAVTRIGERPVLLVATDKGLAAWEVEAPAVSRRSREF
jgi:hypothetical protein